MAYASAGSYRLRSACKFTVESSVYVKQSVNEKGIGSKLYSVLLNELKKKEFHTVIGVISLPNEKSLSLHEKFGLKKVKKFKEVGFKFNKWVDVGYWQLILKKINKIHHLKLEKENSIFVSLNETYEFF